jgi:hypothetical protein
MNKEELLFEEAKQQIERTNRLSNTLIEKEKELNKREYNLTLQQKDIENKRLRLNVDFKTPIDKQLISIQEEKLNIKKEYEKIDKLKEQTKVVSDKLSEEAIIIAEKNKEVASKLAEFDDFEECKKRLQIERDKVKDERTKISLLLSNTLTESDKVENSIQYINAKETEIDGKLELIKDIENDNEINKERREIDKLEIQTERTKLENDKKDFHIKLEELESKEILLNNFEQELNLKRSELKLETDNNEKILENIESDKNKVIEKLYKIREEKDNIKEERLKLEEDLNSFNERRAEVEEIEHKMNKIIKELDDKDKELIQKDKNLIAKDEEVERRKTVFLREKENFNKYKGEIKHIIKDYESKQKNNNNK